MTELLWVRIVLLIVSLFSYLGIGRLLFSLSSKACSGREGGNIGQPYVWLYLWPLPLFIVILAALPILASATIIIALAIGFVFGIIGTIVGFIFAFIAWVVIASVITAPFEGFEFTVKKCVAYFKKYHKKTS